MSTWTQTCQVYDIEITVGGDVWLITGELDIDWDHDPAYGADADGRRGVPVTAISARTWRIESARNEDRDCLEVVPPDIPQNVLAAAAEWAETFVPEDDEP
jgi:hypothetical protein